MWALPGKFVDTHAPRGQHWAPGAEHGASSAARSARTNWSYTRARRACVTPHWQPRRKRTRTPRDTASNCSVLSRPSSDRFDGRTLKTQKLHQKVLRACASSVPAFQAQQVWHEPSTFWLRQALIVKVVVTLLKQLFFQLHVFDFLGLARQHRFFPNSWWPQTSVLAWMPWLVGRAHHALATQRCPHLYGAAAV